LKLIIFTPPKHFDKITFSFESWVSITRDVFGPPGATSKKTCSAHEKNIQNKKYILTPTRTENQKIV